MTEAAAPSSDAPVDIVDMTDVEEPELTYKEKVEKAKAEIEAKKLQQKPPRKRQRQRRRQRPSSTR